MMNAGFKEIAKFYSQDPLIKFGEFLKGIIRSLRVECNYIRPLHSAKSLLAMGLTGEIIR